MYYQPTLKARCDKNIFREPLFIIIMEILAHYTIIINSYVSYTISRELLKTVKVYYGYVSWSICNHNKL